MCPLRHFYKEANVNTQNATILFIYTVITIQNRILPTITNPLLHNIEHFLHTKVRLRSLCHHCIEHLDSLVVLLGHARSLHRRKLCGISRQRVMRAATMHVVAVGGCVIRGPFVIIVLVVELSEGFRFRLFFQRYISGKSKEKETSANVIIYRTLPKHTMCTNPCTINASSKISPPQIAYTEGAS